MGEWRPQVAASILTADFGHLDRVVRKLERAGVDRLHLDVMDGHFVPNITFGPDVVAAFRRLTAPAARRPPDDLGAGALRATASSTRGPETITFHVEAHRLRGAHARHAAGSSATAGRRPASPSARRHRSHAVAPFLPTPRRHHDHDRRAGLRRPALPGRRRAQDRRGRRPARGAAARAAPVHVDGGVNRDTAAVVGAWGVDVCVVGSALFQRGRDTADEVRLVREAVMAGRRDGPGSDRMPIGGDGLAPDGASPRVHAGS